MDTRSAAKLLSTRRAIEDWRDRSFRRRPTLKVRGEQSALRFVNEVGFCFTLSDFGLPVASLYVAVCGRRHPRRPIHTHHDPEIGLTWNLKNSLPAKRLTYYGKLIKGKPTLVSLDLFPAFCAVIREGKGSGDYIVDYRQGRMTTSGRPDPGGAARARGAGHTGPAPGGRPARRGAHGRFRPDHGRVAAGAVDRESGRGVRPGFLLPMGPAGQLAPGAAGDLTRPQPVRCVAAALRRLPPGARRRRNRVFWQACLVWAWTKPGRPSVHWRRRGPSARGSRSQRAAGVVGGVDRDPS